MKQKRTSTQTMADTTKKSMPCQVPNLRFRSDDATGWQNTARSRRCFLFSVLMTSERQGNILINVELGRLTPPRYSHSRTRPRVSRFPALCLHFGIPVALKRPSHRSLQEAPMALQALAFRPAAAALSGGPCPVTRPARLSQDRRPLARTCGPSPQGTPPKAVGIPKPGPMWPVPTRDIVEKKRLIINGDINWRW